MTIKTPNELSSDFPDEALRTEPNAITAENIRDIVDSTMSVGGTLFADDVALPITTDWVPVTVWTNSIDTKGLQEDLDAGDFTLQTGAGGLYAVDVSLGIFSAFAGWIEIAITRNGALTPYRKKRTLTAGGDGEFGIPATGTLSDGDKIGLAVKGSGNADVQLTNGQYRAIRV